MKAKQINITIPETDLEEIKKFCKLTSRTVSGLLRLGAKKIMQEEK